VKELKKELGILANSNRLEILKYLKQKGKRPVGAIADGVGLPFKTVSRQLLYLAKKGILNRRYDGNFVLYEIAGNLPEPIRLVISHLL
jgi:DNA-binding transcriptional ArsR family regulator